MPREIRIEQAEDGRQLYCLTSHRRTITETDIVNFVNLVGLHEAPFIDMEYVKTLPGSHDKRFAPAPLLISLGMGLVATYAGDVIAAVGENEKFGPFHGMVGVEARVRHPVFPGDTLQVELEAAVDRTTSRGQTLVDLKHTMTNQNGEVCVLFTEKIMFEPAA